MSSSPVAMLKVSAVGDLQNSSHRTQASDSCTLDLWSL